MFAALHSGGEVVLEPFAAAPGTVIERVRATGLTVLAAGDGSVRFRQALEAAGIEVAPAGARAHVISGLQVCRQAHEVEPVAAGGTAPGLPAGAGRKATMTEPLEIRRLTYADLPQVIAVERRAFTTPWSLAMFVLELSKPSGICLAALRRTGGSSATWSARATTRSGT